MRTDITSSNQSIYLSIIFCNGEVSISREYDLDANVDNDSFQELTLDGFISFQACDTITCIPINQEIIHNVAINNSNKLSFGENLTSTC